MELLPEYIFWKDTHSIYLGCNQNYARLLGLKSPAEIIGKSDFDLSWEAIGHEAENIQQADEEAMAGYPIKDEEEVLCLPDGRRLITLVSKYAVKNEKGKTVGIIGYFTDISSLKKKRGRIISSEEADNDGVSSREDGAKWYATNRSQTFRI